MKCLDSESKHERTIQRYLDRYAEPHAHTLVHVGALPCSTYRHVLVIPAYDEPAGCIERVLPSDIQNTLVIVVVNAAVDSDRPSIIRTQQLLDSFVVSQGDGRSASPIMKPLTIMAYTADTTLLIIDCCTDGRQLPAKQGVGLARKIGGDVALACMSQGLVTTPWIHYTDADVVLPGGYFEAIATADAMDASNYGEAMASDTIAVALYPFTHRPRHESILLYELSLRYYVMQLAEARSPYAFHTIGSLLCINAYHYASVRGFPKRKAAEDFYMLNKLAKTGAVLRLQSPVVELDSRASHRVPFGTGAMMTRLAGAEDLCFYHPAIFGHLRDWLDCIDALWGDRVSVTTDLPQWFAQSPWQNACWIPLLLEMGLAKTVSQAHRQSTDIQHFHFFLWTWFDAFRTLKFVHYLRDHHYASLDIDALHSACKTLSWWRGRYDQEPLAEELLTSFDWLQQQNHYLSSQEDQLAPLIGPRLVLK